MDWCVNMLVPVPLRACHVKHTNTICIWRGPLTPVRASMDHGSAFMHSFITQTGELKRLSEEIANERWKGVRLLARSQSFTFKTKSDIDVAALD